MGVLVAIEGPSGSGKTTVTELVAQRLAAVALPEAIVRLRPRPSLAVSSDRALLALERRLLAAEVRRYAEARRRARAGRIVVADTGFAGPLTYAWGLARTGGASADPAARLRAETERRAVAGRWGPGDLVVYLATSARERRQRVGRDPDGHPSIFAARHEAVGRVERTLYRGPFARALGDRLRFVSGSGAPANVATRVLAEIRRAPLRPASDELALAMLAALPDPAGPAPVPGRTEPRSPPTGATDPAPETRGRSRPRAAV